jgi:hypothetical protein
LNDYSTIQEQRVKNDLIRYELRERKIKIKL